MTGWLTIKPTRPLFVDNVTWKYKLVAGIFVIWVIQEGAVSEHDRVLKLAAHWEGVAYDSPLQSAHTDSC